LQELVFYVHNNGIIGSILIELADLASLMYLDLSSNHLEGRIPPNLCKILALDFINLSKNALEGKILENCKNFYVSFLANT
jgi:hypothetical protein